MGGTGGEMNAPTLPWDADYFAQREAYMVGLKRAVWKAYKAARRWKSTPARLVEVAKRQTRLIDYRDIYRAPVEPVMLMNAKMRNVAFNPWHFLANHTTLFFHHPQSKVFREHMNHGNPTFQILHETMEAMK